MSLVNAIFGGHEVIVPIVLPLLAGALLLLMERRGGAGVRGFSLAVTAAQLVLASALLVQADDGQVQPYLLGNWAAPWGIALALDRLSALMLLLTATVAMASLLYASAGEDERGPHFHALFQFQLMGLAGAFLTADLFNLFVFFEVLLAASYGLLLHGAGRQRLKAGVHYVVFNLAGSALFLIAVSLLYAVTGTLNMADMARRLAELPSTDVVLAQSAALMLLVVFGVKAAVLPLYFWLPGTYQAATPAVAALFAIMTKVGVYAIARTTTLMFGAGAGELSGLGAEALTVLSLGTLALAALGVAAVRHLAGVAAFLVVASAGTLLLGIGLGTPDALSAAMFYMVHSTLTAAASFLLVDRIAAAREGSDLLQPAPLSRGWGVLGVAFFIVAVASAGVPPLGGFIGKVLLLQAAGSTPMAVTVVAVVLLASGVTLVALARAGSTLFWAGSGALPSGPSAASTPRSQVLAVGGLLAALLGVAAAAGPVSDFTGAAARQLADRDAYIRAVLGAQPAAPAWDVRKEMRERGELK